MNISEAKEELIRIVRTYLAKDEEGRYLIPRERQRPVLLMGGPGIGKTAVMRQIAEEMGISLVSYTITHHTRQSAIGLPSISKKIYGGEEHLVTEYTMSEIVASVYDQIARSGISEGILFLDEINCVSETLAPTMLQFLQYKTFGNHRVPDGYVIVTAGNPPEYNRSVREFDIVTLDRVRLLEVKEDFPAWKSYALKQGIHGAVTSYLEIKKDHFYSVKADLRGKRFATPRGWEDLSDSLKVYEALSLPVEESFTYSFLQDKEIAESFTAYYELYRKYREFYRVEDILAGNAPGSAAEKLKEAPFDEKLSLIGLLSDALGQEFRSWADRLSAQQEIFLCLKELKEKTENGEALSAAEWLAETIREKKLLLERDVAAGLAGREAEKRRRLAITGLEKLPGDDFTQIRKAFAASEEERLRKAAETGEHLTNAFRFLAEAFGEGQEMVLFLSELSAGYYSLKFVQENGNEAFYKYNRLLLLNDQREQLRAEAMRLL